MFDKKKLIILVLGITIGCQVASTDVANSDHFDLEKFLLQIDSIPRTVSKTIEYKGNAEQQVINQYQLTEDLKSFHSYGLPRAGVIDKFSIDTSLQNGQRTLTYTANLEKQRLRLLKVIYQNERVESVELQRVIKTMITNDQVYLKIHSTGDYEYYKSKIKKDPDSADEYSSIQVVSSR